MSRQQEYDNVFETLDAYCEGETDPISLMATVACELYHAFDRFDWVGFYRNVGGQKLRIGPYQGTHGCLSIDFSRGICGRCAREGDLLNIPDVFNEPDHIACSTSTRSEIVVPIKSASGELIAVLDIDSNRTGAFDEVDERNLRRIEKYFRATN